MPPVTVAVGIPADLVRRRPDIRAAELAAAAQSAQIGIAEADLFPAFSLTGSFGAAASNVRSATLADVFIGKGITFAFGPSFSWNILNYGQITNNVRVQDAKLQGLLVDYQNTVLKAQKEVEDGLATVLQFPKAGRLPAQECCRGAGGTQHRADRIQLRDPRLHHRTDRRAKSLYGAERPCHCRRQCFKGLGRGVQGAGRRLANSRRQ